MSKEHAHSRVTVYGEGGERVGLDPYTGDIYLTPERIEELGGNQERTNPGQRRKGEMPENKSSRPYSELAV